ncbi:hypothetical protein LCGC14_0376540 [marine sediment metagenome]|uniref:Uncharacterized protein n=1 Tax=marine sediment metagenome TaxID=412755 RepID=A0A0F9WC78_9ZZZZ
MVRWKRGKHKKTQKSIAWDWMARWVRLKGVVATAERLGTFTTDALAQCYTCGRLVDIRRRGGGQAGHYKPRGLGGGSGTYFDERNIRVQCGSCNGFEGGRTEEFREGLVAEYDEETVQELERLHRLPSRWGPREFPGLVLYYQAEVGKLLKETGIKKWF